MVVVSKLKLNFLLYSKLSVGGVVLPINRSCVFIKKLPYTVVRSNCEIFLLRGLKYFLVCDIGFILGCRCKALLLYILGIFLYFQSVKLNVIVVSAYSVVLMKFAIEVA